MATNNMIAANADLVSGTMLLSEANDEWRPIPSWAGFLIRLGYRWSGNDSEQRRIALVSMPCDSAAAGLIALGALVRALGDPKANDIDGHYDALLRYARQYLESCRDCELPECNPSVKRCGHTARVSGRLRSPLFPRKTFTISERTDFKKRQIVWEYPAGHNQNVTQSPSSAYAINWHIESEPPPQLTKDASALPNEPYLKIIADAPIVPDNLRRSFSGLCLAGRVAGETETREWCASMRFGRANGEYRLSELLTVYGWFRPNSVSRMTFFNARTEQFDRRASAPMLVIADGDASFLKVLGRSDFQRTDVIGVIHRTVERDRLEAVGNKMIEMRQWYVEDSEMSEQLAGMPRGISVSILKKRTR